MRKTKSMSLMMILVSKKALASMMRKLKVTTTMKVLHSCKMTYYALSKKKRQYKEAGYYWTASPWWMCSSTLSYLVTFEMQKRTLTLYCNSGKAIINKKGDLKDNDMYVTTHKVSQTFCLYTMCRRNTRSHMTPLSRYRICHTHSRWYLPCIYAIH